MPPTSSLAARTICCAVVHGCAGYLGEWIELDRRCLDAGCSPGISQAPVSVVRIAHRRRTQVEPAVGDDPHGVEQLTAEKLQPDDAPVRIVRQVFLQQEQVVGQPDARVACKQRVHLRERVDHLNARAAASLIGLQQCRPLDVGCVRAQAHQGR